MKRTWVLLALLTASVGAEAAVTLRAVKVTESGTDKGNDASVCAGFSTSPRSIRRFFSRSVPVTFRKIHDHYNWGPCYARGTATIDGHAVSWEVRIGGTGSYTMPNGEYQFVADPRDRDVQD